MAIINVDTAEYIDVSTAVSDANPGDTINIAADTATWSSTLTINKELTIEGAGKASTVITGGNNDLFCVDLASDVPISIGNIGLGFADIDDYHAIEILDSATLSALRIHHCAFVGGKRSIFAHGYIRGVLDNNSFLNCSIAVGISGDDNVSWARTIGAGTAYALFIEDNTFTLNGSAPNGLDEQVYHQQGARTVLRHNTFNTVAYTGDNSWVFDSHGNQNLYAGDSNDFRGQPLIEVYENVFALHHTTRVFYIRGGSALIYNNAITTETGTPDVLELTDEESWQTFFFNPVRESWPAEDQIMNSFFWGNTLNGNPVTTVSLAHANDAEFIQEDRDYFMHAPQSSGGSESYPTRPGADDMIFTGEGANAYYPYTPYTYPHPLRGEGEPEVIDGTIWGDLIGAQSPAETSKPSRHFSMAFM